MAASYHAHPCDVILTGVPRSGTTLVCSLLNRLDDTIALNEPMEMRDLLDAEGPHEQIDVIKAFMARQRTSLLQHGTAEARVRQGLLDDNTFEDLPELTRLRQSTIKRTTVPAGKPLSSRFQLVIKHPNAFTALLPHLVQHFRCYAIVRHPVAVLASWNTLDLPLRNGHAPMAEAFDSDLRRALDQCADALERQLRLVNWYFEQYEQYLRPDQVIRYEDVVQSGGAVLSGINPAAAELRERLSSRNENSVYDAALVSEVSCRLAEQSSAAYLRYYRLDDLEA